MTSAKAKPSLELVRNTIQDFQLIFVDIWPLELPHVM